jgi:hypothetical protein
MDFAVPSLAEAKESAVLLDAEIVVPDFDDPTPNIALVWTTDENGRPLRIDFLAVVHGVRKNLDESAIEAEILDAEQRPTGITFRVMHPLHMLRSRVANTITLPGYDTPHAIRQVRAAAHCLRAFIESILVQAESAPVDREKLVRAVLNLNEETLGLACDPNSIRLFWKYGIDVFDIVIVEHDLLPEKFRTIRLPQMRTRLASLRDKRRPK